MELNGSVEKEIKLDNKKQGDRLEKHLFEGKKEA
jgi:hypothetical protein